MSPAAGCACKVPPAEMQFFMSTVDGFLSEDAEHRQTVLDGSARDDASLWRISPDEYLALSVDFGTPVSSDPAAWGRIATLNALSDLYATGAKPQIALSVLGWPSRVNMETMSSITAASIATLAENGAVLGGGHTIRSEVPLFGLCVVGRVRANEVMLVDKARPGDVLVLTKPLGTGIITAAQKFGAASDKLISISEGVMSISNSTASEIAVKLGVAAATDVTGYGLIGHLNNLLSKSTVSARISASAIQKIDEAEELLLGDGVVPNSAERNYFAYEKFVDWGTTSFSDRMIMCDPQTSGGLMLAIQEEKSHEFVARCADEGFAAYPIGRVREGEPGMIEVTV
ncbi:selenide, water dikinase SelD [Glycomyces harbinensis]|nr:selenide, water dikinase SelD [Glycomyces harbinensis]